MLGIRRNDPTELKPLKLQLPLRHVLALHRLRIVGDHSVSEIVATALEEYFAEQKRSRGQSAVATLPLP